MSAKPDLDPAKMREILVNEIGIDQNMLEEQPGACLEDLGLDSMALVELRVVLKKTHAVDELPEEATGMSIDELVEHLSGSVV